MIVELFGALLKKVLFLVIYWFLKVYLCNNNAIINRNNNSKKICFDSSTLNGTKIIIPNNNLKIRIQTDTYLIDQMLLSITHNEKSISSEHVNNFISHPNPAIISRNKAEKFANNAPSLPPNSTFTLTSTKNTIFPSKITFHESQLTRVISKPI